MRYFETEKVELKEIYVHDIKKEVIAFINTQGGEIYIGIRDNGDIVGVENTDATMQQVTNVVRDSIRPDASMFTQVALIEESGKAVIKVTVTQGTKRPYYLSEKGIKPTGVYVRQGTSTVPASEDAIRQMIKLSDGDSFESTRSLLQDLSFAFFEKEMKLRGLAFSIVQQKNLGILNEDGIYTNLGLLSSDQCQHTIKIAVFQGTDKLIFKDRREIGGSIFQQLNQAYQAIDFYNGTAAEFDALYRIDERDYPIDAIREALLNAIVHRDYSFSGSTYINIYADRLEIVSLGGLVPGLSLDAALLGASQPRNEKLAAIFYRMKLIEAYGTGINKIISSYSSFALKPEFESVAGAFRVTLPNRHFKKNAPNLTLGNNDTTVETILTLLKSKQAITRRDVELALDIGTTRAIAVIKNLLDQEYIKKIGEGKNTKYVLKYKG